MRNTERPVLYLVVATGICSVAVQLITIREYLALLQGNEFVIALILFCWLILGGIGTLLASGISSRWHPTPERLGRLSLLLAVLAVAQIHAIRFLRDWIFLPGISIGFYPTLTFIGLAIAPYAALVGFLLPFSLFTLRAQEPGYSATRIYLTDNVGDVAGGILFGFVLVFLLTPLQAVLVVHLPLVVVAVRLLPFKIRSVFKQVVVAGAILIILAAGVVFEKWSLAPHQGRLVAYQESRYGRITIDENEGQYTLFKDGLPVASSQNPVAAEEAVHYPLSQLERSKDLRILLIAAESGMLAELEKYNPRAIDYLELDPAVTAAQFRYGIMTQVAGLQVIHQDGRRYLKDTDERYDAIILNLPEPDTFQVNRFFTDEFFSHVKRHLVPAGIFSFAMQGFDNYLAEAQRQKLSVLRNTVTRHFKHVLLLPGQKVFFLCRDRAIERDIPALLAQKSITTNYVAYYFVGNVTPGRIEQLNTDLDPGAPINRDRAPRLMRAMFSQWFTKYASSPLSFLTLMGVATGLYLIGLSREQFVLFTTGCATMGAEILVIFAFQIYYGYIYVQIGMIVTLFLAGLLPGAWYGERMRLGGKRLLIATDTVLILLMVALIAALTVLGDRLPILFFPGFGFLVALACGFQFPVALHLSGGRRNAAAAAFSADLMGASLGTLITSVMLIPYTGLVGAALALIGLKAISLVITGGSWRRKRCNA